MPHPLAGRIAALEAATPEHGHRLVLHHEDLAWTREQREARRRAFLDGLPPHRGTTVVIRRFTRSDA